MINLKKISPIIIFGVPILIGGYFIYKSLKKSNKDEGSNSNQNQENSEVEKNKKGGVTPAVTKLFPLKKGSKGSKVKELQDAILIFDKNILPKYGADKDFGTETEDAVKAILGKKTVDSQDDIDKIITLASKNKSDKATKDATNLQDSNRKDLAIKLYTAFDRDKKLDFRAIQVTEVREYKLTSDGREVDEKIKIYKDGDKIELGLSNTKIRITTNGFFEVDSPKTFNGYVMTGTNAGMVRRRFSPYGFELY
jgi:hypothetical protein